MQLEVCGISDFEKRDYERNSCDSEEKVSDVQAVQTSFRFKVEEQMRQSAIRQDGPLVA
jgi:hypothetical protein